MFFVKDTILYQLKKNQRTQDKNSYKENLQARKFSHIHTEVGEGKEREEERGGRVSFNFFP